MCGCVERINTKLAERDQSLPMAMRVGTEDGPVAKMDWSLVLPLMRKNGDPERRQKQARYFSPSHCPFCGEHWEKGA
ncbi:hypothetical protein N8569_00920 [bacterium]|nr:hypothetical protein [bacterium]